MRAILTALLLVFISVNASARDQRTEALALLEKGICHYKQFRYYTREDLNRGMVGSFEEGNRIHEMIAVSCADEVKEFHRRLKAGECPVLSGIPSGDLIEMHLSYKTVKDPVENRTQTKDIWDRYWALVDSVCRRGGS